LGKKDNANVALEVENRLEDLFGQDDEFPSQTEKDDDQAVVPSITQEPEEIQGAVKDSAQQEAAAQKDPEIDQPEVTTGAERSETDGGGGSPRVLSEAETLALKELKSTVLSMDWEISDEVMDRFIELVGELRKQYQGDMIIVLFFQLLDSLGKYIKTNKGQTHPDAIKTLNSVHKGLENVIFTPNMSPTQKKEIVSKELAKFKKLKEMILPHKGGVGKIEGKKAPLKTTPSIRKENQCKPQDYDREFHEQLYSRLLKEIKLFIKTEFNSLREDLANWEKRK
jgi:hypothetical protein